MKKHLRSVARALLILIVLLANVVSGGFFYAKSNGARERGLRFGLARLAENRLSLAPDELRHGKGVAFLIARVE